jgi:hypothetical protein
MMESIDLSRGLAEFLNKIRGFEPEQLVVPDFYIAEWPQSVGDINIRLRKPRIFHKVSSLNDVLLKLTRYFCVGLYGFQFSILKNGAIKIESANSLNFSKNNGTFSGDSEHRVNCLILFDQLKDEALPKIIAKVGRNSKHNQEVVAAVKKALEPFIPQIVADKLVS